MDAMVKDLKIAYIGGGSRGWARKLMVDLALCPDLQGTVSLFDIDQNAAIINQQFSTWLQSQPGIFSQWNYQVVSNLTNALNQADFVVISIQPGPLEIMAEEIALAEKYGLYYPVGDTTGAPGLIRGLRTALIYKEIAYAIQKYCPKAWVINYTNPMSISTRTLTRLIPELKVFGCCHEVFSTQKMFVKLVQQYLNVSSLPQRTDIHLNVFGINHFTWVDKASFQGTDLLQLLNHHLSQPETLHFYTQQEVESWNDWFYCADRVKFELYQHYGTLAAAGDRHLVEFLPGFIQSPQKLFQWGIIRTPVSWRIDRWNNAPKETTAIMEGKTPFSLTSSGEEGVSLIKALLGLGNLITNVNLPNQGQITNLPADVVVETNAIFQSNEIIPLQAGKIPLNLEALILQHVNNQEMIIESAITHNIRPAFQAFCNDPSIPLPLDTCLELFNQLTQINHDFLPKEFINSTLRI
jgi:alpha-galactosidase